MFDCEGYRVDCFRDIRHVLDLRSPEKHYSYNHLRRLWVLVFFCKQFPGWCYEGSFEAGNDVQFWEY